LAPLWVFFGPNGLPTDTDSWGDDVRESSENFENATNQDDPVDNVTFHMTQCEVDPDLDDQPSVRVDILD